MSFLLEKRVNIDIVFLGETASRSVVLASVYSFRDYPHLPAELLCLGGNRHEVKGHILEDVEQRRLRAVL